jgi:hypothetical protein
VQFCWDVSGSFQPIEERVQAKPTLRKHFVVKFQGSFQPIEERVQGKVICGCILSGSFKVVSSKLEERVKAKFILRKQFVGKFQGSFQSIERGAPVIPFGASKYCFRILIEFYNEQKEKGLPLPALISLPSEVE